MLPRLSRRLPERAPLSASPRGAPELIQKVTQQCFQLTELSKFGSPEAKFGSPEDKFGLSDAKLGPRGAKFGLRGAKFGLREAKF